MSQSTPINKNYCALIPAFMEEKRIRGVVQNTLNFVRTVVVIDDGSSDRTSSEAASSGATVIRHETNLGKGAALNTGFAYAARNGFELLITLDADGQHAPEDIPRFIEAWERTGAPVIVGNRMANPEGMPLIRKLTNFLMSWYLSRQIGQWVPDTQCGFRLYAAAVLPYLATKSPRYAAESETLLRAAAHKAMIGSAPITVIYRDEKSKIRPLRDTLGFIAMVRNFKRESKEELNKPADHIRD